MWEVLEINNYHIRQIDLNNIFKEFGTFFQQLYIVLRENNKLNF
jgi:hypothetical protein